MKVIVKPHKIKIELEHDYNSGEYNVQECNFEFSDEYTGLSKVVIFSNSNVTKEIQIYDDKCIVPAEVLQNEGVVGIGVYGYEVSGDELTLRYSPKPQCFPVEKGSYAEGTQPAPPTPSVVEQLQQQITNNANNISSLQDLTALHGEQIETNANDISAIKSEQTTQNNKIQANTEEIESINGIIPTLAKKTEIPTKVSQLENDSNYVTETEMSNAIDEEKTERENADIELQSQIDAITVSPDVVDVVGTYQELLDYDTSKLTDDDIIKVLVDSTHNDALAYYRWQVTGGIGSWKYIGSEGPFYTKSETDSLLNEKQDEITNDNKLDSDLVSDDGQTNKFVTTQEKNTWNNKQDALTFDNTPTKNSNNPVKSGGIYDFVNTKLEDYVLETDFEESQSLQDDEIARNKMIYNAMPKVSGEGTDLTLNNTAECPVYDVELSPSEISQEADPTPDNPQEIHTVSGENSVKIGNKNLFTGDYSQFDSQGGTGTTYDYFKLPTNEVYTLTLIAKNNFTPASNNYIGFSTSGGSGSPYVKWAISGGGSQITKGQKITINNTRGSDGNVQFVSMYGKGANILKTFTDNFYIQLEKGEETTYEEHKEQSLPLSLGDLEYCKIGDYEDLFFKNVVGSEYYDSTLELDKWYLKKNVGKVNLGTLTWTSEHEYNAGQFRSNVGTSSLTQVPKFMGKLLCSIFIWQSGNVVFTDLQDGKMAITNSQNFPLLRVRSSQYSSLSASEFKTAMTGKMLYYQSTIPTYTLLSDTLQTQLDNIQKAITYQDQTNVSQTNNDLPFVIKLSAIRDLSGIFELIQ